MGRQSNTPIYVRGVVYFSDAVPLIFANNLLIELLSLSLSLPKERQKNGQKNDHDQSGMTTTTRTTFGENLVESQH